MQLLDTPPKESPSVSVGLTCQRDRFSLPRDGHFLNCAYMSPVSKQVEQAGVNGILRQRNPVDVPPNDYFAVPNRVRTSFAKLVNAESPTRIALLPAVSYAMAIAVQHLRLRPGQNVVVVGDEFPSAVLPWRKATNATGAELRTVHAPNTGVRRGALWNERLFESIDPSTAVVVLPHVHWSDGTRFDLSTISERARAVGAAVVVDGTQSIGALPFDVQDFHPDLLVTAGYKWLMGGYGLAVAYFGPRFDSAYPIEEVWTSQVGSDDFAHLAQYRDSYRSDASRFDGGERANFILSAMLHAAIEQLLEWGVEHIQAYCDALTRPWLDRLAEYGVWVEEPKYRASHLFGLRSRHAHDPSHVAAALRDRHVYVSVRGDAIRVSPHVYNRAEDLAALVDALVASKYCELGR